MVSELGPELSGIVRDPVWLVNLNDDGRQDRHVDADIYIVPRCAGIRTNLVCKVDHLPRLRWVDIRQTNSKFSRNAEPTFCAWSDPTAKHAA
jgi:hypothetical protein